MGREPAFFVAVDHPNPLMTRHDSISDRIIRIAEPVCVASGYELVDVRFTMEPGGWVLRVYVDRAPAPDEVLDLDAVPEERVDLNDCERISRELSAVLDVEDPIKQAYSLEVSSPGIDRPLRTAEHYRRYLGAEVKVTMAVGLPMPAPAVPRKNFKGKLLAVEIPDGGAEPDTVAVLDVDGQPFRLPLRDVESARLVPDWDAVLKGGSGLVPDRDAKRAKPGKPVHAPKKHKGGARN